MVKHVEQPCTAYNESQNRGHPQDGGKCPLNRSWAAGFVDNEPKKRQKNIQKSSLTYIPTTLYVEFKQALFIDLSEIVQFVKASTFFISAHLKISTLFVISHILRAKVSPEWRLNSSFRTQKKCPFPLIRGVPSIEETNTKIM